MEPNPPSTCGTVQHVNRRTLLKGAGLAGLSWLTPLSQLLAVEQERAPHATPAKSVILLWLAGGPSQIETFDPHPGGKAAHGSTAIKTAAKNIQIASGLPMTAEIMNDVSLVRSVVSKEGDHERAFYNAKTGYRINPTVVHASMGAIITHELPNPAIEIPTHISIIPNQWPARGGYLGPQYDAFRVGDPVKSVPDLKARVGDDRAMPDRERAGSLSTGNGSVPVLGVDEDGSFPLLIVGNNAGIVDEGAGIGLRTEHGFDVDQPAAGVYGELEVTGESSGGQFVDGNTGGSAVGKDRRTSDVQFRPILPVGLFVYLVEEADPATTRVEVPGTNGDEKHGAAALEYRFRCPECLDQLLRLGKVQAKLLPIPPIIRPVQDDVMPVHDHFDAGIGMVLPTVNRDGSDLASSKQN